MTRLLPALILLFCLLASRGLAQEPGAPQFLLAVDTSFSMGGKKSATLDAIRMVVKTGFHDQIHPGETFSVWTFDEGLDTSSFPPQVWDPDRRELLAEIAAQFIAGQKNAKRNLFSPLVEQLQSLPGTNLVVLLTDGDERIKGTPFDVPINAAFSSQRSRMRKEKRPFVIAFLIKSQQWTGLSIYGEDRQLRIPEVPHPPPPVETVRAEPEPAAPQPQPEPPPPAVIDYPPGTTLASLAELRKLAAPPEPAAPPPAVPQAAVAPEPVIAEPVAEPVAEQKRAIPSPNQTAAATPAPLAQETKSEPPPPSSAPAVASTPPADPVSEPVAPALVPPAPKPREARLEPPAPAEPVTPTLSEPAPQTSAAPATTTSTLPLATNSAHAQTPNPTRNLPAAPAAIHPQPARPALAPVQAVETPNPFAFLAGGLALCGILGLALWRHSRKKAKAQSGSLISQSLGK